jgi:glycerophosphoryl diester phosphodiesterase
LTPLEVGPHVRILVKQVLSMPRLVVLFLICGAFVLALHERGLAAETKLSAAQSRVQGNGVLVIAHRGDSKVAPENTLPAFESAVKAGADLIELDYLHSADGVPVVFHDGHLDRTTNAVSLWGAMKIRLVDKSLAELKLLDAGSWFDPKFAGTKIPTLSAALDVIQNGSMTLIERKHGDAATCVQLLTDKQLLDQVVVQAFDWRYLADCHRLAPELVLGALGHQELTAEKLDQIAKTGASVVGWEDKNSSAETIQAIHDRGWKAWVWTVDDPQRAVALVQAGADGIITNRPAAIRAAIEAAAK